MSTPYPPSALLEWECGLTVQTASHGYDCLPHLNASRLGTALFPTKTNALDLILVPPFGSVKRKAARKTFLTTLCLDGLVTLLRKLAELILMHL
jgi:hypothetical protein